MKLVPHRARGRDTGPIDVPKTRCEAPCCTDPEFKPYPLVLKCPRCGVQHIDEGVWATKRHRVHRYVERVLYQTPDGQLKSVIPGCGFEWQPALMFTVGVERMP